MRSARAEYASHVYIHTHAHTINLQNYKKKMTFANFSAIFSLSLPQYCDFTILQKCWSTEAAEYTESLVIRPIRLIRTDLFCVFFASFRPPIYGRKSVSHRRITVGYPQDHRRILRHFLHIHANTIYIHCIYIHFANTRKILEYFWVIFDLIKNHCNSV